MRLALLLCVALIASPAVAADKPNGRMQTCTLAWQEAGRSQPYKTYLTECLSKPATVATKTAVRGGEKPKKPKKPKGPNRMKVCGAQWQALKAEGKTNGLSWREFSRQCLTT